MTKEENQISSIVNKNAQVLEFWTVFQLFFAFVLQTFHQIKKLSKNFTVLVENGKTNNPKINLKKSQNGRASTPTPCPIEAIFNAES